MSLSPGFIDTIKRLGVQGLASRYTRLSPAGSGILQGKCPNPSHDDGTASFTVYTNNANGIESWCCYGCHHDAVGGDQLGGSDNIAFARWMHYNETGQVLSFPQAVKMVADYYGIPMEERKTDFVFQKNMADCKKYEKNLTDFVRNYLYFRGLNDNDIKKWHLGFDGERITFPIFNAIGEVIGFSNRAFTQKAQETGGKYKNTSASKWFKKKDNFYGINFVNRRNKSLFIVEGQVDAIIADKYGIPNAVATMTSSLSESHIKYIKEHGFSPIVCYDNDKAGRAGMVKAMEALVSAGVHNSKIVVLPDNRDIADLGKDMKEYLKPFVESHTMSYSHYALKDIIDGVDAAIMAKQQAAMPGIRRILESIDDPDEAFIAKQFVSKRFGLWTA